MAVPPNEFSERLQTLEGVLDRLVFSAEESDFIVGRLSRARTTRSCNGGGVASPPSPR